MAIANRDSLIKILNGLSVGAEEQGPLLEGLDAMGARLPDGVEVSIQTVVPVLPAGASTESSITITPAGLDEATVIDARSILSHPYLRLSGGYTALVGHAHAYGSENDDIIAGDSNTQEMRGGAGNDIVYGGAGADTCVGQEGADLMYGNQGADLLYGNEGTDTILGGRDNDTVLGGLDDDLLNGNIGNDFVNGNLGNDTVHGGQDDDTVRGGQGNDELWGDLGNDELWGDLGDDTLVGGEGADRFVFAAGSGRDVITDFNAAAGDRIVLSGIAGYTLSQSASGEAVVVFSADNSVILAGVRQDQVASDWFVAG